MLIWWTLVFLAIFLIGVTKSGFGAGVGLMIVPMMAIAMGHIPGRGSEAALGLMLPLLVLGDLIAVWQYRDLFRKRLVPIPVATAVTVGAENNPSAEANPTEDRAPADAPSPIGVVKRLLPATAVGVVLGGLMLWWFHQQTAIVGALIRIEIGIESIALVGLHWWRQTRGVQQHLLKEPWRSHLTGGFAAVSSTLAHAAGPIVTMYLLPLRLDRSMFVGACAIYFFILNTAKLPAYYWADQFKHAEWSFTIWFTPLVVAGALFGRWLNKRLSDKAFGRIVYFVTFLLGWYILIDGGMQLMHHWMKRGG